MANVEQTQSEVRMLRNNAKDKKIQKICLDIFKAKLAEQNAKEEYARLQANIQDYLQKSRNKGLQFLHNGKQYKIINVKPQKIIWDVPKLIKQIKQKNKNADEVLSVIIENQVVISDVQGFKDVLKQNGIKYKDIEPFLSIIKKVNQKKINELSEIGEVTDEQIEGCYTVEETKGYIIPTESEIEDDE